MPVDLPSKPLIKPWKEVLADLKMEYPEEFAINEPTLRAFLKDADENIAVEEHYLDNPDPTFKQEKEVPDDTES